MMWAVLKTKWRKVRCGTLADEMEFGKVDSTLLLRTVVKIDWLKKDIAQTIIILFYIVV